MNKQLHTAIRCPPDSRFQALIESRGSISSRSVYLRLQKCKILIEIPEKINEYLILSPRPPPGRGKSGGRVRLAFQNPHTMTKTAENNTLWVRTYRPCMEVIPPGDYGTLIRSLIKSQDWSS